MIVLAVDSSTPTAATALWRDGELLASFRAAAINTHSECLLPMIEKTLALCGVSVADVDLLACGVGPGSFTGVRIAVAAVKGLAAPLDKPCVGVSSLEGAAAAYAHLDALVAPVFNARRGNVYSAIFSAKHGELTRLTDDEIISVGELCKKLAGYRREVMFVGDDANACLAAARDAGLSAIPGGEGCDLVDASAMCAIAAREYETRYEKDAPAFSATALSPVYLRPGRAGASALPE